MTPLETLGEIKSLTEALVGLSLANELNFPATHGNDDKLCEITVSTATALTVALKNVAYPAIFTELNEGRCFNVKMLDGALLLLRYRFRMGHISEHALSYFPSPDLEAFQNEPEIYLDDEIYADVIARNIVAFPVRFDFSSDTAKYVDVHHPYSHLTLGQYKNCRVPVCAPLGPLAFGGFILRAFYNTAFRKYSDQIPTSTLAFASTISENERKLVHITCG